MHQSTIHPGHATAAHRIVTGRATELADTDRDRAARVAAAQLPWLAHLPDHERDACLDEILTALTDCSGLDALLARWAAIAETRRLERAAHTSR